MLNLESDRYKFQRFSFSRKSLDFFIDIFLIFLISSALDSNPLKVMVSGLIFIRMFGVYVRRDWRVKASRNMIFLTITVVFCLLNSFYYILIPTYQVELNLNEQLLAVRKFLIECIFAIFLYQYLKEKKVDHLLVIIYWGAAINVAVLVFQILSNLTYGGRPSMMFFEPSAAGFYYCFVVFILHYRPINNTQKIVAWMFTFSGLLVASKAQYLIMLIMTFTFLAKRYAVILVVALFLLWVTWQAELVIFYEYLLSRNQHVWGINNLFTAVVEHGVYGISSAYEVTNTYVTRLSAIYVAAIATIENPLGIGIGTFNLWYKEYLLDSGLYMTFTGDELDSIFQGDSYASTRSRLLSLLVSGGVVAFIFLSLISIAFLRSNEKLIKHAYLSTMLAALMLELNPILDYIVVLLILLEASKGKSEVT